MCYNEGTTREKQQGSSPKKEGTRILPQEDFQFRIRWPSESRMICGSVPQKETDTKRRSKEEEEKEKFKRNILRKAFWRKRNRIPPTVNRFAYGNNRESEHQKQTPLVAWVSHRKRKSILSWQENIQTLEILAMKSGRKQSWKPKQEIALSLRILVMIRKRTKSPHRNSRRRETGLAVRKRERKIPFKDQGVSTNKNEKKQVEKA